MMKSRKRISRKKSNQIFFNSAMKTRKINIDPRGMRGGIKL